MKREELVSIIVPVYNGEKHIKKCIESINDQTYKNIEILIVNDGSTDATKEILEQIKEQQKNIDIIHEKRNRGTATCKNIAMEHCQGEYIFFVDSDDTIEKNSVEQMIKLLNENRADAIRTTYSYNDKGKIIKGDEQIENAIFTQDTKEQLIQKLLLNQIHGFCSGVFLFKKNIILKNKIKFKEDMTIMEDFIFLLEVIDNCDKMITSNRITLYYYQNSNGLTKSYPDIEKRWYNIQVRLEYTLDILQQKPSLMKYQNDMIMYLVMMYIKSTKYIFTRRPTLKEAREDIRVLKKKVNLLIEKYQIDRNKFNFICKVIYRLLEKERVKSLYILFVLLVK